MSVECPMGGRHKLVPHSQYSEDGIWCRKCEEWPYTVGQIAALANAAILAKEAGDRLMRACARNDADTVPDWLDDALARFSLDLAAIEGEYS
jgi:hypothetical protein